MPVLVEDAMKFSSTKSLECAQARSRSHKWRMRLWISFALVPVFVVASFSQQPRQKQLPKERKAVRAPLSHIYMHFLLYQNHLDKAAEEREKEGKDGSSLRDHLQKAVGFTPSEFSLVRESARDLETKLKANRAQAIPIIQRDRAIRLSNPSELLPARISPSPELVELRKQREELIKEEETNLDSRLGPEAAAKLQAFLKDKFVRNPRPQLPLNLVPESRRAAVQP